MKNKIFTVFAVIVVIAIYAFNNPIVDFKEDNKEGIQFHKGTWNEALALAKKENKLIFLDIYATWCGPCKKLKKNTFSNEEVGKLYNSNFINVALDGEQAEGEMLANRYNIGEYPSLLFIDSTGNVVEQSGGYMSPERLIQLGNSVLRQ